MKKILIMAMISFMATLNIQAETSNIEMCKAFIEKAKKYQETMKAKSYQSSLEQDDISEATLAFYKDEVVGQCGNIASKMPYDKNFFANALMKQENTSVNNCKMAIKMAKSYAQTDDQSFVIAHAHKVNVVDNCGTLMAKKAPSYCPFEIVDNSKEGMKKRCLASVKKANAFSATNNRDIELVQKHKDEIRENCGALMTKEL